MIHIEQFIGWKQAKNKKTVVLKVQNGNKIVVIMENGKIIKNTGLEFKYMEIKINMKVDGCKIWDIIKVLIKIIKEHNG